MVIRMSASQADIAEAALFDSDVDKDIIFEQTVASAANSDIPRTYATPKDAENEMRSIALSFHTDGGFDVSAILDQPPLIPRQRYEKISTRRMTSKSKRSCAAFIF